MLYNDLHYKSRNQSMSDQGDHIAINKAFNLSVISLFGAVVPIVGLVLAIIAIALSNSVDENPATIKRRGLVRNIAIFSIILALLAGFGWYSLYKNRVANEQARVAQEQMARQQDAESAQRTATFKQNMLDTCLSTAYQDYTSSWEQESRSLGRTDGKLPNDIIPVHEQRYTTAKNECYMRNQ